MIELPRFCAMCATALVTKVPEIDNRERQVCPKCGYIHYLQPKVAAGALVERDGEVLIVRRGIEPRKGFWSFPCGFMEIDEDLEGAARRETEEETGLSVTLKGPVGTYSYTDTFYGTSIVVAVYRAWIARGSLRPGDDVTEARFVKPGEIPWEELAFRSSRDAFRDWIELRKRG